MKQIELEMSIKFDILDPEMILAVLCVAQMKAYDLGPGQTHTDKQSQLR